MSRDEMFVDAVRSTDDLGGVFEYDGETGYFYLHDLTAEPAHGTLGAIHVLSHEPDFAETDVTVRWNRQEDKVGLFIRGDLWAVFDGRERLGGNYQPGRSPQLPSIEQLGFEPTY